MKMKTTKTIITALLLLFSISSFAQTKEETIAWIKEKLEKYGGGEDTSFINVQVSPCSISFTQTDDGVGAYYYSFNPSLVKQWNLLSSAVVERKLVGIIAMADVIRVKSDESKEEYWSSLIRIRNGESDIHERMIKALLHLATFCEEGKNEAF